jgi:hypothetical protein
MPGRQEQKMSSLGVQITCHVNSGISRSGREKKVWRDVSICCILTLQGGVRKELLFPSSSDSRSLFSFFVMLGIEPRALQMLGRALLLSFTLCPRDLS